MRPLKLYMDTRPEEQPAETFPFGKNGIAFDLNGAKFNEPGFALMAASVPYILNGVIPSDEKVILFSTDNTHSAIGYFNPGTELYEPIVNDATWALTGKFLGFNINNYITGTAQRNHKGEVIVAFTDKTLYPFWLNCDTPNILTLDDLKLQPTAAAPRVGLDSQLGGTLLPGTYYVAVAYEKYDGTAVGYSEVSPGITIAPGTNGAGATDRGILITISNADIRFNFAKIAVISKVNGKTTAVELSDWLPVTANTITVFFSGDNPSDDIPIEKVLTPVPVYTRTETIGQLNDQLFLGGLEIEPELSDMQLYANMVQIKWNSLLIDATSPPPEHVSGIRRSFMHEEAYALFIRYHKTRGGFTKGFVLNGPLPLPGDTSTSSESTAAGFPVAPKKFQVEDTIPTFDVTTKSGIPGIWVNNTELYPDRVEFDSSALGGPNLRNQHVRHFKMPSLRWVKTNLYSSESQFGKTKMDLLSLTAFNINIPDKYIGVIDGYEILYAKRTSANMTIFGQAPVLYGAVKASEMTMPTGNANIYTSGGNWTTSFDTASKTGYDHDLELRQLRLNTFRFHAFDILLNKPSVVASYLSYQYKLRSSIFGLEDGADQGDHDMPTSMLSDFTTSTDAIAVAGTGNILRAIKSDFYLAIGLALNKFNNQNHENTLAGTLYNNSPAVAFGNSADSIEPGVVNAPNYNPGFEEVWLANLVVLKQDLYTAFYTQTLVSAGYYKSLTDHSEFFGGDTFASDYTFHTYGRHDSIDNDGDGIKGIKVIRRLITESASNIALRYEIVGNQYSKWYPRTSVVPSNPAQCYITMFERAKDPNQFGYTRDLNALNDFVSTTVFNIFIEQLTKFPYRVHRGGIASRQTAPSSWRTFLALDFYECQKNMGVIRHIEGMDDRLLIHHEKALFITQDKAKLNGGLLSITLGTGDIFQFAPQEALSSPLGYAGSRHDVACVRTPIGYVFVDTNTTEAFIFKGQLQNLNAGVNRFFIDFLTITDRNPFAGNGITIGYDPRYERLLFTVKNKKVPATSGTIKIFVDTDEFFDSLVIGDIVDYFGRLVEYQGANDPEETGIDCPPDPEPEDVFAWLPIEQECVQDEIITVLEDNSGVSFATMLWNNTLQKMYVCDLGGTPSNFMSMNPDTLAKSYIGSSHWTGYAALANAARGKIYMAGLDTGGLKVFNTLTEGISTIIFGTDAANSRAKLWFFDNTILALDNNSNTISIIDMDTENVIITKNISTDIPSGSTYFTGQVNLVQVMGTIWVIPENRTLKTIAVYDGLLAALIGTINIADAAPITGFGGSRFYQSAWYDILNDKVYIRDGGSMKLFIYNGATRTLASTISLTNHGSKTAVLGYFTINPLNGRLYFNYDGIAGDFSDGTPDLRVYWVDRVTYQFLNVKRGVSLLPTILYTQSSTDYLWGVSGATITKYLNNG